MSDEFLKSLSDFSNPIKKRIDAASVAEEQAKQAKITKEDFWQNLEKKQKSLKKISEEKLEPLLKRVNEIGLLNTGKLLSGGIKLNEDSTACLQNSISWGKEWVSDGLYVGRQKWYVFSILLDENQNLYVAGEAELEKASGFTESFTDEILAPFKTGTLKDNDWQIGVEKAIARVLSSVETSCIQTYTPQETSA